MREHWRAGFGAELVPIGGRYLACGAARPLADQSIGLPARVAL